MSKQRIRFAIIGAGNITSLRHIPALVASQEADIVGVIDRNEHRARQVAMRLGLANHATDLSARWLSEIDAVTIGVPPRAHAEVAGTALELGKHVLLEKPMAMTVEEGRTLVERARARRRVLAVVHNFQFARSALKLKSAIESGKLGNIRGLLAFQTSTAERRLPVWHEELPLGLFYDEAPHFLYLLRTFGGNIDVESVTVTPSTQGKRTPAVITAHFRTERGPAVLYNNFEAPVSEWHFAVFGERYAGVIDVFRDILVMLPHDRQHLPLDILRTTWRGIAGHLWGTFLSGVSMLRGTLLYGNDIVVKRFIDAIRTGQSPAGIAMDEGLSLLELQHQILDKAQP